MEQTNETSVKAWATTLHALREALDRVETYGPHDPGQALRALNEAEPVFAELVQDMVDEARRQGVKWREIANAMGLEYRQKAQNRWGRPERHGAVR